MEKHKPLQQAVNMLLKPLIKVLIDNGVSFNEFSEWSRETFVEVADKEFAIEGEKQTSTRISVLTGIFRKDVARIRKQLKKPVEADKTANRIVRIIGAWHKQNLYSFKNGNPKPISIEGTAPSLEHLTKSFGGDVSHQAIKKEMERLEIISVTEKGMLQLHSSAYVPSKDQNKQFELLGRASSDLLSTMSHNIKNPSETRLQMSVSYENLSIATVEKFKSLSEKQSMYLLKELDSWLSKNTKEEKDNNNTVRAGLGIYFFEEKQNTSQEKEQ